MARRVGAFRLVQFLIGCSLVINASALLFAFRGGSPASVFISLILSISVLIACLAISSSRVRSRFWDMSFALTPTTHELAEQVKGSAKMSELGVMAAGLGHEINNAVAVAMATAHMLALGLRKEGLSLRIEDQLKSLNDGLLRVARVVRGMQTYMRNADHDPFADESVLSIIDDALALCQQRITKSGIALEVCKLEKDIYLECRRTEISQVLVNLLINAENAVASHSKEGWIKLSVFDSADGSKLVFAVIDSGPGVPESIRDRILMPFFTTKPLGEGTGLGLSLSKEIVDRHGGNLELDETCEHTRFLVTLPKKISRPSALSNAA